MDLHNVEHDAVPTIMSFHQADPNTKLHVDFHLGVFCLAMQLCGACSQCTVYAKQEVLLHLIRGNVARHNARCHNAQLDLSLVVQVRYMRGSGVGLNVAQDGQPYKECTYYRVCKVIICATLVINGWSQDELVLEQYLERVVAVSCRTLHAKTSLNLM